MFTQNLQELLHLTREMSGIQNNINNADQLSNQFMASV